MDAKENEMREQLSFQQLRTEAVATRKRAKREDEAVEQCSYRLKAGTASKKAKRENDTSEQRLSRLEINATRGRARRKNETAEQRSARLEAVATRCRERRENETAEQRSARLEAIATRKRVRTENETAEQRSARLEAVAIRCRERRENETAEQRSARLEAIATRKRVRTENETAEQRSARLEADATRCRERRENETAEQRSARLEATATRKRVSKENETNEERRARLNQVALIAANRAVRTRYSAITDEIDESQVPEYYIGPMTDVCKFCLSKNFASERPPDKKYSACCHKGKVQLEPLRPCPSFLKSLMTGNHPNSKHFMENIRAYNSSLAFASMGADIAPPPGFGPYCFRIHGQIYHRTSMSLIPHEGQQPKFAQLYILDAQEALEQRMDILEHFGLNEQLTAELDALMRDINPYAEAYKMMAEVEKEEEEKARAEGRNLLPVIMSIRRDAKDDQRRYNAPKANEVAIIFQSTDGEPPIDRDIRVYLRGTYQTQQMSILDKNVDPMTYPILFPYGERGWDDSLTLCGPGKTRMSHLQFYAHKLAVRDEFNPILNAGKLTQQFIVDAYSKIEANRLNYVRMYQQKLRVEQYKGLLDHLEQRAEREGVRPGIPVILPSSFQGSPRNMRQNYYDSMAVVRKYGKPDLFITMTCNPKWREIQENLKTWQKVKHRPDLVARVFELRKKNC